MIDLLKAPTLKANDFIDRTLNNDEYWQTRMHMKSLDVKECGVSVPQVDMFEMYANHDAKMETIHGEVFE